MLVYWEFPPTINVDEGFEINFGLMYLSIVLADFLHGFPAPGKLELTLNKNTQKTLDSIFP